MSPITDEYLNLYINENLNSKVKNLAKGGRMINVNENNKEKIRNILNKRIEILNYIKTTKGKIARKQKQIESLNPSIEKVFNKISADKEEKLKTIKENIERRKKEELKKKIKRGLKGIVRILKKIKIESVIQGNFIKFQYETNARNVEQYFNLIKSEVFKYPNIAYISVPYKSNADEDDNQLIWRTISRNYFQLDINYFTQKLEEIITAQPNENTTVAGSDPINTNEYSLYFKYFTSIVSRIQAQGSSDSMLYKVKGIKSEKGYCVSECLKECGINILNMGMKESDFKSMFYLINFIENNQLDIAIVANGFTIKSDYNEMLRNKREQIVSYYERKKNGRVFKEMYCSIKLNLSDINVKYVLGSSKSKFTILYDEINKHCDIIENNKLELEDVYLSSSNDIFKDGKLIFKPNELNKNSLNYKPIPIEYIFFDYETVIDFNSDSCMKPYSISILRLNDEELKNLDNFDSEGNLEEVSKIRTNKCITFMGYDCNDRFIEWIVENQFDKSFVFIGFNNTNFDNFLLLSGLLKYKGLIEINVSEIFYNGSQLLNFIINGRHTTFDIRKHLMGSLKNNCESFKIKCCSKKSFNHNKAQQLHEENKLLDFINNNEELKEYNEFDVLATAVLYQRYVNALNDIDATKKYARKLFETKTIGSLIYKVFTDKKKEKKFDLPKLTYEQYKDLQRSKIAGRVEMFNGVQKVEERLVSTDVCSLYPYQMAVNKIFYPCGDIVNVDSYQGDDEIGFYYCDIDQRNLKKNNLPNIYAEKTGIENIWNSDKIIENYLISNVMIGLLRKFGCSVVIRNGFTFTKKMKSCEMFDFILDLMKAKNEQDTLNKKKDALYNPALRETLKLLQNSLSGKIIEGLHTEKTVAIETTYEYLEKTKNKKSINCINMIGKKLFLTYEDEEEKLIKQQRPIYLGVLVYDYSKRYMYENSYSKIGLDKLLYTDTDASKFRYNDFINWKNWVDSNNIQVPHWEEVEKVDERYKNHKIYDSKSKVFGSFEDELEKMVGDSYTFYCLEKKSWCYSVINKNLDNKENKIEKRKDGTIEEIRGDLKIETKYRFKGLNGDAIILNLDEEIVKENIKNKKDGSIEVSYKLIEDKKKVYNFYNDNSSKNIDNNTLQFFEKLYKSKNAFVLCSSFRKIVKNSLRNVKEDEEDRFNNLINNIQMNFMIKQLNLK
jgi:hypothetical protein